MNLVRRVCYLLAVNACSIELPYESVKEIIGRNGIDDWFLYAFKHRKERWHICEPSLWILENIPKTCCIFETGCGCGFNLIWFAQKGFKSLLGSDMSEGAIAAGKELCLLGGYDVKLWQDNSIDPRRLPTTADIVLALNWTYHVPEFCLSTFLSIYEKLLNKDGYLVIDVIDIQFNNVRNNEFLTSDWGKPVQQRRPTEYRVRYSQEQVADIALQTGFKIRRRMFHHGIIPRTVYILAKRC